MEHSGQCCGSVAAVNDAPPGGPPATASLACLSEAESVELPAIPGDKASMESCCLNEVSFAHNEPLRGA